MALTRKNKNKEKIVDNREILIYNIIINKLKKAQLMLLYKGGE